MYLTQGYRVQLLRINIIFNQKHSIRIAGYLFYNEKSKNESGEEKNIQYDIGLEIEHYILKSDIIRFYALFGIKRYMFQEYSDYYFEPDKKHGEINSIGLGFGVEFVPYKRESQYSIIFFTDIGERFYNKRYIEKWKDHKDRENSKGFGLTGSVGIVIEF